MTDADFDYKNTEGSPFSVLAKKNVMILDGLGVMCGYLARSLDKKKEDYDNLTKRVEQMRADKMNQTLYALTLVTAFSVPMGFFTGRYMDGDGLQIHLRTQNCSLDKLSFQLVYVRISCLCVLSRFVRNEFFRHVLPRPPA